MSTCNRPKTESIAACMEAYTAGNAAAFARLYAVAAPRVRRQLQARLGRREDVEDLVQLTFLLAHLARHRWKRPPHDPDEATVSWLCAIARNAAANFSRHSRRRMELGRDQSTDVDSNPCEGPSPEQHLLQEEHQRVLRRQLHRALARLPPGQREVIRGHRFRGETMAEIGQRLGLESVAVRVRAHRAYRRLSRELDGLRLEAP